MTGENRLRDIQNIQNIQNRESNPGTETRIFETKPGTEIENRNRNRVSKESKPRIFAHVSKKNAFYKRKHAT